MKVVINTCFGGFGLSTAAEDEFRKRTGYLASLYDVERNDPDLVAIVEEMGEAANGQYSKLKVVEIPDDVQWIIEDYDGRETIAEKHRTWC
jgi:hypothetical protein